MNKLSRISSKLVKLSTIILVIYICVFASNCSLTPPPFAGPGIRVTAGEAPISTPSAVFPVAGATVTAILGSVIGPGSGTTTAFSGFTNSAGVLDRTDAQTNANWTIGVVYAAVLPGCPLASGTFPIPPAGAVVDSVCFL